MMVNSISVEKAEVTRGAVDMTRVVITQHLPGEDSSIHVSQVRTAA
jgi:hypothetical protein